MTPEEIQIRRRLMHDFPHYASKCLQIRTKKGEILPFDLNIEQQFLHSQFEKQLAETGKVRAIVLKGRQQGCSTYVGGRFYHRTSHRSGVRAFILTHEDAATANLFEMTNRYHDKCPKIVKPSTGKSNEKELYFDKLDSGYKVGTARTKGVGRSSTIQYFHGSEVAFWPNAETHIAGIMQAIPDIPGTEVILESTANGLGNYFHQQWQEAESGDSEYIAIFIPWFWNEGYRKPLPANKDIIFDKKERGYQLVHGLDDEQIYWRRLKIVELKSEALFKQEYPATPAEAFQTTGVDPYINPELVLAARKRTVEGFGAHIVGVDPARMGKDRMAIIHRLGRKLFDLKMYKDKDAMECAGICHKILTLYVPRVDRMFIDIGYMPGVYDRLVEMGHGSRVRAVNFGSKATDPDKYTNVRNEIWTTLKEAFEDKNLPMDIPDNDVLHADLTGISIKRRDSHYRPILESKEDMRARGLRSPDCGDAAALCYTEPVRVDLRTRGTMSQAELDYAIVTGKFHEDEDSSFCLDDF